MFAKYSTIVLCLSFVSALDVSVSHTVQAGASVDLDVAIVAGDPTNVGLLLCVSDGRFDINLNRDVAVTPTIKVDIPAHVAMGLDYFIAAIEPGNAGIIYSKSNLFQIQSR